MPSLGRKTLKSVRARSRNIDIVFEHMGYGMIIAYFFFTASAWLSHRDIFRIDSIEVLGAYAVDKEKIDALASDALAQKLLFRIDRNNSLLYPRGHMTRDIYLLDGRVKSVSMKVVLRKHLVISIEEYAPKLLACPNMSTTTESGTACYLGDDEGYVFARAPEYSGYFFPIFVTHDTALHEGNIIGAHILPRDEFLATQDFLNALREEGFTPKKIEYLGAHDYEIMTERPWNIRWSSTASSTQSINNLNLVLASISEEKESLSTLEVVDLRFGNKIFYH
ncbi:MAG: hypothetical protein A2494_02500 [Candidatus Lloydbacteria bacterium RIFOXYC12_FULL_46_25]|uniref:POTRA domain-containing protein n=1 Tax=Candidatus Lloydbacteria bacterium RIFOXYC12_FULL_46_25 TaxID=1798670 RepID=A0A1G2DX54_9BACT|nr:MAG: hypothetical protein A2494_02500 [Candidatus Lloydbacteria bacterium RIFOXYC12_FULL_46_25]